MSVGAGREARPARSAAAATRPADAGDPAPGHGTGSRQPCSANRRVLTVLGAITAGIAAAIACSSGVAVATSAILSTGTAGAYTSMQPGRAGTASAVAVIMPASASPAPSPSPSASSASPSPSATPTPTPTATSSPTPSPTPSARPSPDPSTPSATPSPTKRARPHRTSGRPSPITTPGQPMPTVQAQAPVSTQAARPSRTNKPPIADPSAAESAADAFRLADPPHRDIASTLHATADAGPTLAAFAVTLAALGALAGCAFVLARRQRAHPRWVPKHSRRATRRSSYGSTRK